MARQQTKGHKNGCAEDLKTKDKLLASIHKISSLLTRPISLDRILTSIVKETSLVFAFTRLAIFLVNKERNLLECRYIHGFNPQDSERALRFPYRLEDQDCAETQVARLGKTIYIKAYHEDPRMTPVDLKVSRIMRRVSTIAVPLKIKKDIIGLITADKGDIPLSMTKKDIKAFSTFANQASIIIENARLQEVNQGKIEQLMTLQEVSKKASSAFNLEELFQVISASALTITKASCSALFLLDEEGRYLHNASARGFSIAEQDPLRLKVGAGIIGQVAKTGTPVLVDDVQKNPMYRKIIDGVASQLTVPLINDKRVMGVLHVGSRERSAFSGDDLKVLLIFAGHAASLIKNVRLYGQVMTERNFRENILESSPNSIITINLKKEISSINKRTEEIFGLRRKHVLGARIEDVFVEDITRIVNLALEHHAVVYRKEVEQGRRDGTGVVLGVSSSLLRTHQGDLIGAMLIVRDLTEEKKTEELIRRIDRLTSLGQLSAGIAHEIRNPLTSINFNVQLLAKKGDTGDAARNLIKDTQEGIDRIRILIKGMLDFAKPSLPSLKSDSLLRVVQGSIALLESQLKEKKVEVRCEMQDNLPPVVLDAHQIQQVLVNLLLNGMQAMPEGGVIRIVSHLQNASGKHGDHIQLQVIDQGSGISRDNLSRIFNPFFTTKPEGTGLGLSIVHKILEQHNIIMDVLSERHRGTTFILQFPIEQAETTRCTDTGF